ncbi:MAG: hypothetical protein Q9224_004735 [Gallowayella concinna]
MSRPGFLRLPIEIRFIIYSFLLVSPSAISVWPATTLCGRGAPAEPVATSPGFRLALDLLRCNSTVAAEAATIFYGENTFRIHGGDRDYRLAINWLKQIGLRNRRCLGTLEMRIWTPLKAWQRPDGMRTRFSENNITIGRSSRSSPLRYWDTHPRHPHLPALSIPCPAGQVDVIDPMIETIIALIAQCGGRPLRLYLNLGFLPLNIIPGIEIDEDLEAEGRFHMDLPYLIEKWRAKYTWDDRLRDVDVLWTAYIDKRFLQEKRTLIDEIGWQIVEEREDQWSQVATEALPSALTLFLKRKKLTTALVPTNSP